MGRIPGGERFAPYTKWMLLVLMLGVIVWSTPHTMIASRQELVAMGGSHHPFLGVLGVMSAKNTAVNLMILTTFLSFLMYRRANKEPVVPWAQTRDDHPGRRVRDCCCSRDLVSASTATSSRRFVRIGFSVYQVGAVLATIIIVMVIDVMMARGARLTRRNPLGPNAPALAIRAFHSDRHVHLADGFDGLCPQRHPAALARLGSDAGHQRERGHARARVRSDRDQHLRADLPRTDRVHLLARRPG